MESFFRSARIFSESATLSTYGMPGLERRVGNARQHAPEVGGLLLFLEHAPKGGVSGGHEQQNGDDGAHRD